MSDDPDDHIQFTEALNESSTDVVLLAVMEARKATSLLAIKRHIPDFIIVDFDMMREELTAFMAIIESTPELSKIPVLIYGDAQDLYNVSSGRVYTLSCEELSYSELRALLRQLLDR